MVAVNPVMFEKRPGWQWYVRFFLRLLLPCLLGLERERVRTIRAMFARFLPLFAEYMRILWSFSHVQCWLAYDDASQ
jgi:hypothetical protein